MDNESSTGCTTAHKLPSASEEDQLKSRLPKLFIQPENTIANADIYDPAVDEFSLEDDVEVLNKTLSPLGLSHMFKPTEKIGFCTKVMCKKNDCLFCIVND